MNDRFAWWNNLRHGGLLLDAQRLANLIPEDPPPLDTYNQDRLRRRLTTFEDDPAEQRGKFINFVTEAICGFSRPTGEWYRASEVKVDWSRRMITGESVRPRHHWIGKNGANLPVFIDDHSRLGVGRGKRIVSHALQWLRQGDEQLALITNGHQWRLLFAGLDYEAFCEWDISVWFSEGEPSPELAGLRALFDPQLWTPEKEGKPCPLLAAINDSRKGQADLSHVLGERVRQAVELLVQGHAVALNPLKNETAAQDIYRAGVRVIMRMVVVLFAESREGLRPRDHPIYTNAYSLQGLREQLEGTAAYRLRSGFAAWPRVLALFRLIHEGSSHEALVVPTYDGGLFAAGDTTSPDGMRRALTVFENACFQHDIMTDAQVREILDLLTRTKLRIRQGRASTWVPAPVDFSSLDSEYIGVFYEGLLDFELRTAPDDQPIIFLAVGNQPALPLATLESMDDRAIKKLLEKMKDTSAGDRDEEVEDKASADEGFEQQDVKGEVDEDIELTDEADDAEADAVDDLRHTTRARAEIWARRASELGKLLRRPRGKMTPEKKRRYEADLDRKARHITTRVVLPGEWYLVRWGGTRKGSGTFYTRPQLAVPTVHRTLRPLAYDPPKGKDGQPHEDAPVGSWTPKSPEEILSLKVCDPACGSGSFPLAALRFLTKALYASLHMHDRIRHDGGRAVIDLIRDQESVDQTTACEALPCGPDDDDFEPRTKSILRRYVVERCIYGVDLDPLAVEICRLSLWIETLDPRLPLTFLDHKIKCGNSLIGTWFDQFMHYPPMAWMRKGGDKNHTNGIHFKKEAWTNAIKAKVKDVKRELIDYIDGAKLNCRVDLSTIETVHDVAEQALQDTHGLGIREANQRAEFHGGLLESAEFRKMKFAFDLWCSIWFWPPEQIDECPLPMDFYKGKLGNKAKQIVTALVAEHRFFHWELEFPDVFNQSKLGFDAVLGNPPWDIAKPNRPQFFSSLDPLFRGYLPAEANARQKLLFQDPQVEFSWLGYNSNFKSQSNWVKYSGHPYGDRVITDNNDRKSHDLNIGDRGRASFAASEARHVKWRHKRKELTGYADAQHPFRRQGSADLNLYKLFLEQAHAITRESGRMGVIVPSGIYSDDGATDLRTLFLKACSWEWVFGFTNTQTDGQKIFDIHPSYKFNPIIVVKGGHTKSIHAAFMRRDLHDWEVAESIVDDYSLEMIHQFSPYSLALVEYHSPAEKQLLTRIYDGATLLGEPTGGWALTYDREFDMTNHAKLFPARAKWEQNGYKPDEYGRWLRGTWEPIENRVKRLEIPEGTFMSAGGASTIDESSIETDTFRVLKGRTLKGPAVARPLYQGIMVNPLVANRAMYGVESPSRWTVSDTFSQSLLPKFLVAETVATDHAPGSLQSKYLLRSIARTTDTRTIIGSPSLPFPAGNSVAALTSSSQDALAIWKLGTVMSTFVYDWQMRHRIAGTNVNLFSLKESAIPRPENVSAVFTLLGLSCAVPTFTAAPIWLRIAARMDTLKDAPVQKHWALTPARRTECLASINALAAMFYGLTREDVYEILRECDYAIEDVGSLSKSFNLVGFWRVDKTKRPELRLSVLTLVAFEELLRIKDDCGDDVVKAAPAFATQNNGEGWHLPDHLRLSDYDLGHDARARTNQPVRECFGPRFYDWQLAQSAEESWRECHLHARNLLGHAGYAALLDELAGQTTSADNPESEIDDNEPFQLTGAPKKTH